jgi:hypothetical protein
MGNGGVIGGETGFVGELMIVGMYRVQYIHQPMGRHHLGDSLSCDDAVLGVCCTSS